MELVFAVLSSSERRCAVNGSWECGMPRLATVVWLTIFSIVLGSFAGAIYFWATERGIDPWS